MQQVLEILGEVGVEKETVLKEKQTITIQKRPMIAQVKQNSTKYVNGTVSRTASVAKFKQAERKIQQAKISGARLFIESAEGYPFGCFPDVSNLLDEDKYCLKSEEGEVLLIIFWATWSKGSLKPMQRIQQMLSARSEQWKNAVRVVAVNVDEKKEDAISFIKQQSWTNLHHLTTNGWNKKKDPLLENFAIEGVPFVVLVDRFGKVDYEGDPNHLSFEGRIAQLLQQQAQQQYVKPEVETTNYTQNYQQTEQTLRDLISADKINQIFADSELFCAKLNIQSLVLKGVTYKQFHLQAYFFEADNNALSKTKSFFEIIPKVQIKINEVKYIQVPEVQSPNCWQCNSSLNFPYYWLKWEEGAHFGCVDCVQKESTKEGHHFEYEKNSVLLTGKWKRIPIKGLGNNILPQNIASFTKVHEFACNNCDSGSPVGQARYICLGCRAQPNFNYDYVDFCQSCISKVSQLSAQKCFEREMHCVNHPWLRVLYQAGSYQRF